MKQRGLFSLSEHLKRISEDGDPLEVLAATIDLSISEAGWLMALVMVTEPRVVDHRLT